MSRSSNRSLGVGHSPDFLHYFLRDPLAFSYGVLDPRCFTVWAAGGGIQPGLTYGETDPFGYNIVADPVHVHDFHATVLSLLGIDHERLTFKHQGRYYRLTDIAGKVVKGILA